jgi:hypothetical protein
MRICAALALIVLAVATALAQAGSAKQITWGELAANPGRYMGQQLEIAAVYCAQGGASGTGPGYQCSTEGNVYIGAPIVSPAGAKKKSTQIAVVST